MTYATLTVEVDDAIAIVTINRPEVRNAVNQEVLIDLRAVLAALRDDDRVGVVVFTGAGERAFVAGADIAQLKTYTLHTALESEERRIVPLRPGGVEQSRLKIEEVESEQWQPDREVADHGNVPAAQPRRAHEEQQGEQTVGAERSRGGRGACLERDKGPEENGEPGREPFTGIGGSAMCTISHLIPLGKTTDRPHDCILRAV